MSTDPEAKLFYGYIKPMKNDEEYDENDDNYDDDEEGDKDDEDDAWSDAYAKKSHGCTVDMHGYDEHLSYFLAVKESFYEAKWDEVKPLDIIELGVKQLESSWDEMLRRAATEFGIDLDGLTPGWHLVCLYL